MDYNNMTIEELEKMLIHSKNCINSYKNSISRKGKKQAVTRYKEVKQVLKERSKEAKR